MIACAVDEDGIRIRWLVCFAMILNRNSSNNA
jgi:hypothetical protein